MAAIRRRVLSLAATGCIPDEAVRTTLFQSGLRQAPRSNDADPPPRSV